MPITFINNYAENQLESLITNKSGDTLFGEAWVYRQFIGFQVSNFVNETWYFKHNYNLSIHPGSKGKVEGQIDFLLLSKSGLLVIEVKGGGIRVDENDRFYAYKGKECYEIQNPFTQAKEYVHTLKDLIGKNNLFVYKAIVLPHEAGFDLIGPQLMGYRHCFYSKKSNSGDSSEFAANKNFFEFISKLAFKSKQQILRELNPSWTNEKINESIDAKFPLLSNIDLKRIKNELFPNQESYGYNPDKINSDIILNENYEILRGLRKNSHIIIQGKAGTGKTVIAQKFIAENFLKQKKGILFCANKLLKSKLQHILINEYKLDSNSINFKIYHSNSSVDNLPEEIDFLVFDEAQEYFDKGLFDLIERSNKKYSNPKTLILYDIDQTIVSDFKEITWYEDFFIQNGFSHYYFDEVYRCIQSKYISEISEIIKSNAFEKLVANFSDRVVALDVFYARMKEVKTFIEDPRFLPKEKIILVDSSIAKEFAEFIDDYFRKQVEELTEINLNIFSDKIRYTTPIKYRGLETKFVFVITPELNQKHKREMYIGSTRAIEDLKVGTWN